MLSEQEFSAWCTRLRVFPRTRSVIEQVRSSEPARRVGGGRQNVSGRYPSRKMGFTIQFESHCVELAGIYEMEHNNSVLEYYDQPPSIRLDYLSAEGRHLGVMHTPDFFVIRQDTAGWEEWKTEEELVRLAEKNPNRYHRGEDRQWHSKPGEEYAKAVGLYYQVRSSREIDWVFQRNIRFLEDYFALDVEPCSATRERVKAYVGASPGISLQDLIQVARDFATPDDIYRLIASDHLGVDLRSAPLAEPDRVPVFLELAAALLQREDKQPALIPPSATCSLTVGAALKWDGKIWKIVNVGEEAISLLGDDRVLTEIPVSAIEKLVRERRITTLNLASDPGLPAGISDRLSKASEEDLQEANKRIRMVNWFLSRDEGQPPEPQASPRTLRRWLAAYRSAEHTLGCGYLGLLPRTIERGNRAHKLPEPARALMAEFIGKDYETLMLAAPRMGPLWRGQRGPGRQA
jgi:putative transposase